ncbi:MAG: DUF2335 domain-containing protein [Desulfobacterales bacterium]|nr:DUF2335 domain-containing protein [Desulfobacterales bacterium]
MTKRKASLQVNQSKNITSITQFSYFQNTFPSPETLERYNEIIPGLADRLFKLFETQVEHRHTLEKKVIISDIRDSNLG